MTYETGQPIVFVGTGQTYTDLRNLNVNAVVKALLKSWKIITKHFVMDSFIIQFAYCSLS